jgi:hypothetical protein
MAMDIELRNSLGALTAQVQALTQNAKTLDTTLAGALDKGAKGAGGMAEATRRAHGELSLAETVSMRLGRVWTSQMFSLAAGYVGVNSTFNLITDSINRAIEKAENRAKAVRDFADKSRPAAPPALLPELRRSMRQSAMGVTPDQQASALKSYLEAGGSATEADVGRMGSVVDGSYLLGFSGDDVSAQYAKLQAMGVKNPEDLIYSMTKAGKAKEIEKLKPGAARAQAGQATGSWNRALAAAKTMAPEDYRAWAGRRKESRDKNEELQAGMDQAAQSSRVALLEERTGPLARGMFAGPFGLGLGIKGRQQLAKAFPGMNDQQIEAQINRQLDAQGVDMSRVEGLLPAPVAEPTAEPGQAAPAVPAPIAPPHWGKTVRPAQPPPAARQPVAEVRIVGDSRPVPVNAGD